MSIGFYVNEEKQINPDELAAYWQANEYQPTEMDLARSRDGVRLLTDLDLEEAAICMRGANPATRISGVRSMLRNIFGFATRGDGYGEEKPKEPEKMMPEDMPDEDMPDDEDTVDEADIDAIVSRFTDAIKGVVMEMAKEKKACGKPKKTTMPEEAKPDKGMDDDEEAEAMSALLMAEHLLTDLELEAALKEGR